MQLSQSRRIDDLSADGAEIIAELDRGGAPVLVTHDGEPKAVLQSARDYHATQETLALLQILELGRADVAAGRTRPIREAIESIRAKLKAER